VTDHLPLAQLVSFGAMVFSGSGAPTGTDSETTVLQVKETATRPIHVGPPPGLFPRTSYGYAGAPLSTAEVSCTLVLTASSQSDGAVAQQVVEDAFGGWWNAWTSTYTWGSWAGVSGQVGELCALDVSGTSYVAQAELLTLASKNMPGAPADQQIPLTFSLLAPFAAGTPASAGSITGAYHLPTLQLVSFGPLHFTGPGAPTHTDNGSTAMNITATADRPRSPVAGNPYGVNVLGLSAGALSTVDMSTTLYLKAADGLAQAATFQAIEDCWNTWERAWRGTYTTLGGISAGGQVGSLVVKDAYGTQYQALAEMQEATAPIVPGEIALVEIPLTFRLLGQFGLLHAIYDRGFIYDTGIIYG